MNKPRFPKFHSFQEFWPFYVGEHKLRANRILHYVGAIVAVAFGTWALATGSWGLAPLAVVFGYAFAWAGHFFIEHNIPATWGYVWWSFLAEFKMLALGLTGRMGHEVRRLQKGAATCDKLNASEAV